MERPLHGKNAIVTGASRGIGRAIALRLATQGANLVLIARTESAIRKLSDEIEKLGVKACAITCDVSESNAFEESMSRARQQLGAIDILVNNAGIYKTEPIDGHSLATWRQIIETNLTAALVATRAVLGQMKERRWGRIINISSISGRVAEAYGGAYSASKFGMIGLTQATALEAAQFGVTVNAVCPGWVRTQMAKDQFDDPKWCELVQLPAEESEELTRLSVPQMRLIEPEEVAGLVLFLCTDDARGITGQSINICGGLSLH